MGTPAKILCTAIRDLVAPDQSTFGCNKLCAPSPHPPTHPTAGARALLTPHRIALHFADRRRGLTEDEKYKARLVVRLKTTKRRLAQDLERQVVEMKDAVDIYHMESQGEKDAILSRATDQTVAAMDSTVRLPRAFFFHRFLGGWHTHAYPLGRRIFASLTPD